MTVERELSYIFITKLLSSSIMAENYIYEGKLQLRMHWFRVCSCCGATWWDMQYTVPALSVQNQVTQYSKANAARNNLTHDTLNLGFIFDYWMYRNFSSCKNFHDFYTQYMYLNFILTTIKSPKTLTVCMYMHMFNFLFYFYWNIFFHMILTTSSVCTLLTILDRFY